LFVMPNFVIFELTKSYLVHLKGDGFYILLRCLLS